MAELVEYYIQQFPKVSGFIVWAHNTHVSTKNYGFKPMGTYIKELYGVKYYAIASSFNKGSFNAQIPDKVPLQVQSFTLPVSPKGSIDWMLKEAKKGNAFFNLRTTSDTTVIEWLSNPQRMHWVGALFSNSYTSANYLQPFTLKSDFDGIFFFEKVTQAVKTDK
jgi:erythromycin esterase-like protein